MMADMRTPRAAALITVFVAAAVVTAQAPLDGEWAGSGGTRLVLKSDAAGLTGSLTDGVADGGTMTIEQGSVTGPTATFTTTRILNGNVVTIRWTATMTGEDTIALSRVADASDAGREGRGRAAGARGRGERGAGPRAGGRAGGGRAGRGGRAGAPPSEPEAGPDTPAGDPPAGRVGGEGRGRSGEGGRGRAGEGGRGRAGSGGRGRQGDGATRGGDLGGGFPEILHRVR
jgi:hypothetical protein